MITRGKIYIIMNIISKRKIWYIFSSILIIPGIIGMILWKIPTGIDFQGGSLIDVQFKDKSINTQQVEEALKNAEITNPHIQPGENGSFIIRTETLEDDKIKNISDNLSQIGEYQQNRFEIVGPTVSNSLKTKAIIAVIVASLAIIIYIAIAFRKIPKPASSWRFGVCAVFALIHDLLFVLGVYAFLGHFLGYEVNSIFITALLTIMGFSVHDTIVVFDRVRENLRRSPSLDFETNVNNSVLETLNRSLNTTFTLLIVLFALYFLGGHTLREFILALIVGVTIGTYSSIFIASPLLVSWQLWSNRRLRQKHSS